MMSTPHITSDQARWFRMKRSGLVDPFPTPEAAASALIGIQAQIEPAAGISLWNRTSGLTASRFDELIYKDRTLVKLWGQRGTLHLYASSDWPLIHTMRMVNTNGWVPLIEATNVTLDAYGANQHQPLVERIAEILHKHETMGRSRLRTALAEQGIELPEIFYSPWGGIFGELVRLGHACHAGRIGGEGHFAHRLRWLPNLEWDLPTVDEANLSVMRQFFATYGPATIQDFIYWRTPKGNAKRWFAALKHELAEVEVEGQPMVLLCDDLDALTVTPPARDEWPVKMLFRFEPYLLAHKDKTWVADAADYKAIWRPAGHIEGIVLVHGWAAATWGYEKKGKGILIEVRPFKKFPRSVESAVQKIAPQIAQFFALPLLELKIN